VYQFINKIFTSHDKILKKNMEETDRLKNFELNLLNKKNDDQGYPLSHYFSQENVGNQN